MLRLTLTVPEAVQQASATNPRKRTAGPYTGMGSSSGQRSRKRRNNDRNRESEDSDELEESESSILDDSTNSKIKREDGMAKKPSKPKRTMTQIVCIDNGMSGSGKSKWTLEYCNADRPDRNEFCPVKNRSSCRRSRNGLAWWGKSLQSAISGSAFQ